ncbi:hypothetical protein F7725_002351 [Dissostichus mawsoni]|uniref:POPDC1-3 domain-containing protein n=1 Tax=Dissostichus mawsoni TaxID=36200 RepID=A0A7J5Y243_DISMA|nr:hypothetical protein F7725_002351 [Dissostichus mawsoni]
MSNLTLLESLFFPPLCDGWTNKTEGAIYHLGNTMLVLGYMGGSGPTAFGCLTLWGWMTMCGLDVFTWNLLLLLACLGQICHLLYRLHQEGIRSEEMTSLYQAVYLPLGVPVQVFQEIAGAFESKVVELKAGETINVSLEGQFLHYIHRHQFLDSPEWESLRPNEEGKFQVTMTAEEDSRYISWRRRRLYLLMSKHRYISRVFSVMLGHDIAEKLYNLNDKLYIKCGVLLDIRLPSLYHVLAPSSQSSEGSEVKEHLHHPGEDPAPTYHTSETSDPDDFQPSLQGPRTPHLEDPQAPLNDRHHIPWASDPELPTGEDSTSLVLEDFADVAGSLTDYGTAN